MCHREMPPMLEPSEVPIKRKRVNLFFKELKKTIFELIMEDNAGAAVNFEILDIIQ